MLRRLSILVAVVLTPVSGPLAFSLGDDGLPAVLSPESVEDLEEEDGESEDSMMMVFAPIAVSVVFVSMSVGYATSLAVPIVRTTERQRGPPRA